MAIFKSHLYKLGAYKPPLDGRDPSQHLLLDFNERTLPVGEPIRKALQEYIESDRLQLYPSYGDITETLANYAGVPAEQVMITNGSDQGIELLFRACGTAHDEVIIPEPNFAMYHQCARIENMNIVSPHYDIENGFPVVDVIAAVTDKTRVICIANPNNPSGVAVSREDIARVAEAAPKACILVDECYFEYSKLTVADLIAQHPNIVITRTFSKTWGLPSLRFGYLMASAENIQALLSVRGPYDINQLAVVAARAALANPEYTDLYVKEVMEESKPLLEEYCRNKSLPFWPSAANYLWIFPDEPGAVEKALNQSNILVRPKKDADGALGLRITIGSLEQTRQLISVLDTIF